MQLFSIIIVVIILYRNLFWGGLALHEHEARTQRQCDHHKNVNYFRFHPPNLFTVFFPVSERSTVMSQRLIAVHLKSAKISRNSASVKQCENVSQL